MNQQFSGVSNSNLPVILTCMLLGGCVLAEAPTDPVAVHRGRLKFSDTQALFATIGELNALPKSQSASAYLEERFAGFQSLADIERDLPAMTPAMRSVLNPDGSYQVGDRIFLILGNAEYIIPESEEDAARALVSGASDIPYLVSGRIRVNRLTQKTFTETSNLLNAKYQREFSAAGHQFKFVHEAFVDRYDTYLMACLRSKFEYKDGSTWRHASEIIEKEIDRGVATYALDPSRGPVLEGALMPYQWTVSSLEIASCAQLIAPFGTCLGSTRLTGSFHAAGTQPHTIGQSYDVAASWESEFSGIQTCNR